MDMTESGMTADVIFEQARKAELPMASSEVAFDMSTDVRSVQD